jgi:hypothetical protein
MIEDLLTEIMECCNKAVKSALTGNYIAFSAYMVEICQKAGETKEQAGKRDQTIEELKEQIKRRDEHGEN